MKPIHLSETNEIAFSVKQFGVMLLIHEQVLKVVQSEVSFSFVCVCV